MAHTFLVFGRHEKQDKATAARAQQLASQSPGIQPGTVNLINVVVAYLRIERPFHRPRSMQEGPKKR